MLDSNYVKLPKHSTDRAALLVPACLSQAPVGLLLFVGDFGLLQGLLKVAVEAVLLIGLASAVLQGKSTKKNKRQLKK